jgi:hypothetical protein
MVQAPSIWLSGSTEAVHQAPATRTKIQKVHAYAGIFFFFDFLLVFLSIGRLKYKA